MKKGLKVGLIVFAVLAGAAFVFLWLNGFELSRFLPRRGYA